LTNAPYCYSPGRCPQRRALLPNFALVSAGGCDRLGDRVIHPVAGGAVPMYWGGLLEYCAALGAPACESGMCLDQVQAIFSGHVERGVSHQLAIIISASHGYPILNNWGMIRAWALRWPTWMNATHQILSPQIPAEQLTALAFWRSFRHSLELLCDWG
jgi:hypothetical protein